MLPGYFVFPSLTQKAADENRSSPKPPAVWIHTRNFGKQSRPSQRCPHSHGRRGKSRISGKPRAAEFLAQGRAVEAQRGREACGAVFETL